MTATWQMFSRTLIKLSPSYQITVRQNMNDTRILSGLTFLDPLLQMNLQTNLRIVAYMMLPLQARHLVKEMLGYLFSQINGKLVRLDDCIEPISTIDT